MPVGDGGRTEAVFVQTIFGEHFEFVACFNDRRDAFFARRVNFPVGEDGRSGIVAGLDADGAVNFLPGLRVETPDDPFVANDVEIFPVCNGRGHVRAERRRPEQVRLGDVAAPARAKREERLDARWRVDDAVVDDGRTISVLPA